MAGGDRGYLGVVARGGWGWLGVAGVTWGG